jgi:hypothetical protein
LAAGLSLPVQVTADQAYDCHGIGMKHVMPRVLWRLKDAFLLPDLHYPELFSAVRPAAKSTPFVP